MSAEHVFTAVMSSIVTLISALGLFMARSKFSDVARSGSLREETAVTQMAAVLDKLAEFQRERETRLLDIQEKALDTVTTMTAAVKEVTLSIQAHDANTGDMSSKLGHGQRTILAAMNQVNRQLEEVKRLLENLCEDLEENKHFTEGVTRESKPILPK